MGPAASITPLQTSTDECLALLFDRKEPRLQSLPWSEGRTPGNQPVLQTNNVMLAESGV